MKRKERKGTGKAATTTGRKPSAHSQKISGPRKFPLASATAHVARRRRLPDTHINPTTQRTRNFFFLKILSGLADFRLF
jgi:hypothetical protein